MNRVVIMSIGISLLLMSCSTVTNKQALLDNFIDMRSIPSNLVSVKKIRNYEIAYQEVKNITENYNYPNNYSIGKLNEFKDDYRYVVHVSGISPFTEFDYIKQILDNFESDSTYVDVLIKEDNQVRANIYRLTKERLNADKNYMMWKWVRTIYGETSFQTDELMNEHLFQ